MKSALMEWTGGFHTALRETHIKPFLDNWALFDAFTEVSKTDPGAPGGPSAPH